MSTTLKLVYAVGLHLFMMGKTKCLCPSYLTWIPLHLEVLMTLLSAKSEYGAVVADKLDTVTRVHGGRAEVTFLNTHDDERTVQ